MHRDSERAASRKPAFTILYRSAPLQTFTPDHDVMKHGSRPNIWMTGTIHAWSKATSQKLRTSAALAAACGSFIYTLYTLVNSNRSWSGSTRPSLVAENTRNRKRVFAE